MIRPKTLAVPLLLLVWGSVGLAAAGQPREDSARAQGGAAAEAKPASAGLFPVYRPPLRGAPQRRVGGGTRGEGDATVTLRVLAPDHVGWSLADQPTLYWYLSKSSTVRVQLTLVDDRAIDPLLELEIDKPQAAGIHPLRLADHGIHLQPGAEYQWFVALVADNARRSQDLVAGAVIEHVAAPECLNGQPPSAQPARAAFAYARCGLWYDALDAVSEAIRRHPEQAALHLQRAALLEQVGISDAADHERRQAGK